MNIMITATIALLRDFFKVTNLLRRRKVPYSDVKYLIQIVRTFSTAEVT